MKPHQHHEHHDEHGERVKDQNHRHNEITDGLSTDMQNFYSELRNHFGGGDIRITSGRRAAKGGFSHHHHGDAMDIGKEHTEVYEYLYNTSEGLALMNKYGVGILDETNPATLKKTGGTGPHFHIGKDSGLVSKTHTRYNMGDEVKMVHSFIDQNPAYDYTKPQEGQAINNELTSGMQVTSGLKSTVGVEGPGQVKGSIGGIEVVMPNTPVGQMFMKDLEDTKAKNEASDKKIKESADRAKLAKISHMKQARQQQVINAFDNIRARDNQRTPQAGDQGPQIPASRVDINIQGDLPELPTL